MKKTLEYHAMPYIVTLSEYSTSINFSVRFIFFKSRATNWSQDVIMAKSKSPPFCTVRQVKNMSIT